MNESRELLFSEGCVLPLLNAEISLLARASLCESLGEAGCPDFLANEERLVGLVNDPFLEAILRSCWCLPTTEKQVQACVEKLENKETSELVRDPAVGTLIRLGQFEKIPVADLTNWFQLKVVEANAGQRKRSLTILSVTDGGRSHLLQNMRDLAHESLQSEIANVLHERVGAVQRTGRYDFISKQDCQRILEALKTRKSESTQDK